MQNIFEPISGKSVVEEIIDLISNLIIEKKFRVGQKIPNEYEIASQLNVSRSSVREALKILNAFGVLEIKRGNGTYISNKVKSNNLESLSYSLIMEDSSKQDIVDLRVMLDLGIYYLLITRIKDENILTLENKIKEQEEFINSNYFNEEKFIDLDIDFHLSIAKITKNTLIEKIYITIMRLFKASMIKALKNINPEQSIKNHKEVIKLFKDKDMSSVIQVINKNVLQWQEGL
jgi:GntR family transcriptional repressor for pyruvate dehydrogenase complex